MEISVKMTAEEFLEFTAWRENRGIYEAKENRLRHDLGERLEGLATSMLNAVTPVDDSMEKFEIVEQGHMSDAWNLAQDVFA